jgi:hypothetical protein
MLTLVQEKLTIISQNIIESYDELPEDMEPNAPIPNDGYPPNMVKYKVAASVSFADDADIFGLKLVNNHVTRARFEFMNSEEEETLTLRMIGGSLWPLDEDILSGGHAIRNLTTMGFDVDIPPQSNVTVEYPFATELQPQDLTLLLAAIVEHKTQGVQFQVDGYNSTVSVVDAPVSLFDPQILTIYALLAVAFAGTCYFIYAFGVKTLFPQAARKKGSGRKSAGRKSTPANRKQDSQVSSDGAFASDATASGAKVYDEQWIPQHLQRPEGKRSKSGTPKTKSK